MTCCTTAGGIENVGIEQGEGIFCSLWYYHAADIGSREAFFQRSDFAAKLLIYGE
jgi:hypothetical protein